MWLIFGLIALVIVKSSKNGETIANKGNVSKLIKRLRRLSYSAFLRLALTYFLAWLSQGLCLFLVLNIWRHIGINNYWGSTLSYVIAWISGFINPFTPNGIAIREGVMMVSLANFVPVIIAVSASIIMRLLGLIGEIMWAMISWGISKIQ